MIFEKLDRGVVNWWTCWPILYFSSKIFIESTDWDPDIIRAFGKKSGVDIAKNWNKVQLWYENMQMKSVCCTSDLDFTKYSIHNN